MCNPTFNSIFLLYQYDSAVIVLDNYLCGDDKEVLQDELTWVTVLLLSVLFGIQIQGHIWKEF